MKHTPAPWHLRGSSRQGYSLVSDDAGETLATTHGTKHRANARLIAVAPEMYDAIAMVLSLRKFGDGGQRIAVLDRKTAAQLRELLNRAE